MLQLTPQSRIFVALAPVDFRNGIDGLAALCRRAFSQNPLDGAIYVFRNRTGTTLKVLYYDGQGYWLCTKRLSAGRQRGGRGRPASRCGWRPANSRSCSGMVAPTRPPWRMTGAKSLKPAPGYPGNSTATTPPVAGRWRGDGFARPLDTPGH